MEVTLKQNICFFIQLALPILSLCAGLPYGNRHHFIESPKLSRWGDWGKLEHCPSDQVVVGMRLKVHENQGVKDDTGLNGIKFYCQNPYSSAEYAEDIVGITSLLGTDGEWKDKYFCPAAAAGSSENKLIAVGFQLRSESSSGVKDDTAGNNLKLVCSDLYQKQGYTYLEGDGTQRGEWTDRQLCWPGYAICGLQTQVETSRSIDTTGLNNMKVRCCKIDSGYHLQFSSNANASNTNRDSIGSSSSSSENSGESSDSGEKDGGNDNKNAEGHLHNRGDHAESIENSAERLAGESRESPDEQELVAIVDPEPTEDTGLEPIITSNESTGFVSNQTSLEIDPQLPSSSSSEDNEKHSSDSNEDDNLPEEIAQIDQVDNSEAHNEEEENVSTVTDAQQHTIPEEVVNALEDADSIDSSSNQNDHHHQHPHPFNDKPFHWGTMTNFTDLSEIINGADADVDDHVDGTNSLEEPQSSPRFGQIAANSTTILEVSNHASQVSSNWRSFGIGSMVMLYVTKILF